MGQSMSDDWMNRMSTHSAMNGMVHFLVDTETNNCVGIRVKETGQEFMEGDEFLPGFLKPFKTLNEACFYDFGKDMKACADEK